MADNKNMNDMAFKNDAIRTIMDLKNENLRLKDNYGRRGNMADNNSEVGKIKGLRTLEPKLGRQFMKNTIDDMFE